MQEQVMRDKGNAEDEFAVWMRQFYNRKAGKLFKGKYEYYRWFSTPMKRRQYKFSTISLLHHLKDIKFKNCLEIGCGPGTWTKLLLKKYPHANFICLDISKEMISQFKNAIKEKRVKTFVNNFLEQNFKNKKFDFIFSSRAIEYIPNKPEVIKKIYSLLEEGGKGMIITSPPHHIIFAIKRALGKRADKEHTQRIFVKEMKKLLEKAGFINIKFYPILFSDFLLVPTSFLFRNFYKREWGIISRMFASGYIVNFEKLRK